MQLAASAFLLTGLMLMPQTSSQQAWVNVKQSEPNQVMLEPVVPARLIFRIERGAAPATGILKCRQQTEQRTAGNVSYPVLVLSCDGELKMVLTDVDLTQ